MSKDEMPFKEIRKIHKECPVCEIERDLIYGETKDILKIRGLDIEVASKIYYCPEGEHYFYSIEDEEDKFQAAYRECRKRKGLLQPEEIRAIRKQYRLSQKNFSLFLGWGDITIHRYETGAIQDDAHNDVLALIKDVDDFKKLFESKKNNIDPVLARKVEERLIEIEREKNRQSVDLLVRIFSLKNTSKSASIGSAATPIYLAHSDALKYCANEELALAA